MLALNGSKDHQVPAGPNLNAIREALAKGGNKSSAVKEMEGLNHLFQKAETGSEYEYGKIEETINPELLETVADWILATTSKP